MELLKCTQCGAIGLEDRGEYFVCPYCHSQYQKTASHPQADRPASKRPAGKRTNKSRTGTKSTGTKRGGMKSRNTKPRTPRKERPQREIVYVPGKPFNKKKLLFQIAVVVAVVLAVVFTLSLFFKVQVITVSGNSSYSADAIAKASGVEKGDSLLGLNDAMVSGRITTALPYVENVRIGIKLPGTVIIHVAEHDVLYAIADDGGQWWLINSDGRIVEKTDVASASGYTRIEGVVITGARPGKEAVAEEQTPSTTGEDGATQPVVTITGADRLYVARTILDYLEENGVLGEMTRVDVTNMASIKMQYGQRFSILLGDSADLEYKIDYLVASINQLKDYDKGTLDASFHDLDQVVYTPDGE